MPMLTVKASFRQFLITSQRYDSASLFNVQQIETLPMTQQLHAETAKDPLLFKVLLYTKNG